MKILGREIQIGKIIALIHKYPSASILGMLGKLRPRFFIDQFLKSGYSLFPSTICIEITYRCNLRCKTCWFYGNSGIFKNKKIKEFDELSFIKLKKLIDDITFWKPYVYITGGEPLLNKNTLPLIRYAVKKRFITGVVTNGILINTKNAEDIIKSGLSFLTISIDGPANVHDSIRGVKCFEKAILGIENIVKMKKKHKSNFPILTLNCTISDENYAFLEKLVDIAEKFKVDILALQHPCFLRKNTIIAHHNIFKKCFGKTNNLVEGYGSDTSLKINPERLFDILNKVKKLSKKSNLRLYQDFSLKDMKKYYETENAVNKECINPWFSALIKPNGDVTPCLGYVVGNISKNPFMEIWNNKKIKKFRRILKQKKFFPGCIRCCGFFFNWRDKK